MKCGIAGLDEGLRVKQCHAGLGIVSDGRGNRMQAARYGIAGLDHQGKIDAARCGIAGVNTKPIKEVADRASSGAVKASDEPVSQASYGVAGNLHTGIMHSVPEMLGTARRTGRQRLGDVAAEVGHEYGVYFSDYSYIICTDDNGRGERLRWRKGRESVFDGENRLLPLFLDSTAYRRWTGKAPKWVSLDTYLAAIDMVRPDGFAAYDVIGDQAQSLQYFDEMTERGYGPETGCFPVYHVRPGWSDDETVTGVAWRGISPAARVAVANARRAVSDPVMQYYAGKSQIVGLGGMVRGPIPRDVRHYYIAELCRLMPDHQFWALGQANFKVVNGLGAMGLLDRVWTDGSWWILDAACERFAVVMGGQIVMHSLEGVAQSFFSITECMAANLRSLLAAYANLWEWPPPDPLPLDQNDRDQAEELYDRMYQARLDLFGAGEVRICGNVPVRILRDA